MSPVVLSAVMVGTVRPLSDEDPRPSAIDKRAVRGPVWVTFSGLVGDHQADRTVHGGPDKALNHYPFEHYVGWRDELPAARSVLAAPGAFGENLSTTGWTEHDVCLGDVVSVGSARLQISHGRQPCSKLTARMRTPDKARRVTRSLRSGWYYRVLQEGELEAGDVLTVVERPHPDWSIARVFGALFGPPPDTDELTDLLGLEELAATWRERARSRLQRHDGPE